MAAGGPEPVLPADPSVRGPGSPDRRWPGPARHEGASPQGAPLPSALAPRWSAGPARPGARPEPPLPSSSSSRRSSSDPSRRSGPFSGTFRKRKAGENGGRRGRQRSPGWREMQPRVRPPAPSPSTAVSHLPTVHRAGEDQQGAAAAFTGRQSLPNPRFCSRSSLKKRRGGGRACSDRPWSPQESRPLPHGHPEAPEPALPTLRESLEWWCMRYSQGRTSLL